MSDDDATKKPNPGLPYRLRRSYRQGTDTAAWGWQCKICKHRSGKEEYDDPVRARTDARVHVMKHQPIPAA